MANFINKIGQSFWNNLGPGRLINNTKDVNSLIKGDIEPKIDPGLIKGIPPTQENLQKIQDATANNIETGIGSSLNVSENTNEQNAFDIAKKLQEEQWAREDEIRKETQEREDTAYTRAVRDMQRAGINPNLMNVTPASSGGGITSATGMDYNLYEKEFDKNLELLKQEIDLNFQGKENAKDRIFDLIGNLLKMGGLMSLKQDKK